jgi:hypothetical protein
MIDLNVNEIILVPAPTKFHQEFYDDRVFCLCKDGIVNLQFPEESLNIIYCTNCKKWRNLMKESKGKSKIGKVMKEFKAGDLHSGSKKGSIVKNPKQATAIALSEAKKAGAKIPPKGKK